MYLSFFHPPRCASSTPVWNMVHLSPLWSVPSLRQPIQPFRAVKVRIITAHCLTVSLTPLITSPLCCFPLHTSLIFASYFLFLSCSLNASTTSALAALVRLLHLTSVLSRVLMRESPLLFFHPHYSYTEAAFFQLLLIRMTWTPSRVEFLDTHSTSPDQSFTPPVKLFLKDHMWAYAIHVLSSGCFLR